VPCNDFHAPCNLIQAHQEETDPFCVVFVVDQHLVHLLGDQIVPLDTSFICFDECGPAIIVNDYLIVGNCLVDCVNEFIGGVIL